MVKYGYLIACYFGFCHSLFAQLPVDSAFQGAVYKQTRTLVGLPGEKYWQNTAKYELRIHFDPASRLLKGEAKIAYKNNSPDTLRKIWFKLYPNLYKKGVMAKSKIDRKDLGAGIKIEELSVAEHAIPEKNRKVQGTNMVVNVPALAPGKSIQFSIRYYYTLNEGSHIRTGQIDDGAYFIAYFFPRIAVYDDIDGWNKYPYTGEEEFYNDFCDFNVEISVPKNYMVWATGELTNAKMMLRPTILNRLTTVERQSDTVITLINKQDLEKRNVTRGKGRLTYQYQAKDVPDFAFAISDHYVWKATSLVVDDMTGRKTRVDAVYNPLHHDYKEVIDFAAKTVKGMSYHFPAWPFPYAHMTVFDGLDQMEYPMMANDNPTKTREDGITLTNHEIFHSLFPFYMGINETKFGWMDEGWATIGEWKLAKLIDSTYTDEYGMDPTSKSAGEKDDTPIMTLTPELKGIGTFTNSYPKPALGYLFIEEYLGEDRFKKALHHYMRIWHGKHPQPLDFFNSMNAGAGEDLDWFWKPWFYDGGVLDLALSDVQKKKNGYAITVKNKSHKPLPVHLTLYYKDGSKQKLNHSIGVWKENCLNVTLPVITKKKLQKVTLGDTYVPDKNEKDNVCLVKQ